MRKAPLWLLLLFICLTSGQNTWSMTVIAPSPATFPSATKPPIAKKPLRKALLAIKAYKILKLAKKAKAEAGKKPVLGTLSLVSGALGLVLLFTLGGFGLIFSLAAIILGVIAPKKRGEKGRTEAIIGLVLGALALLLILVAVIAFAAIWNN